MPIIKIIPIPGPQGPTGPAGADGTGGGSVDGLVVKQWGYPTPQGLSISGNPGESVALKSSDSASIRYHVRDGGSSAANWSLIANTLIEQTGEMGVGPYQAKFAIDTVDVPMPTGYYYSVSSDGGSPWDGIYLCTASTTDTITLEYPDPTLPGANEDFPGGLIFPPSIYNQVEANEDGVWIKNADWTSGPGSYINYWHFQTDGVLSGPAMGFLSVYGLSSPQDAEVLPISSFGAIDLTSNADINLSSNSVPSAVNINTYLGAVVNSARTSGYAEENRIVATLGDLPTGATGSFESADGKTITVTNGIITGIE